MEQLKALMSAPIESIKVSIIATPYHREYNDYGLLTDYCSKLGCTLAPNISRYSPATFLTPSYLIF
ncbi:MAG: hypothetical protein MJE68_31720 [Proteobacteria bacterium]|nr:hypothetical protein [Pseudomonadota bacterium]